MDFNRLTEKSQEAIQEAKSIAVKTTTAKSTANIWPWLCWNKRMESPPSCQ